VLNAPFFENAGNALMKMPVIPFTKFNFTVITGDMLIAVVLVPFVWMGAVKFIPFYREKLQSRVESLKIARIYKMSNFYKLYQNYKGE
jgi:hypothetical protein